MYYSSSVQCKNGKLLLPLLGRGEHGADSNDHTALKCLAVACGKIVPMVVVHCSKLNSFVLVHKWKKCSFICGVVLCWLCH